MAPAPPTLYPDKMLGMLSLHGGAMAVETPERCGGAPLSSSSDSTQAIGTTTVPLRARASVTGASNGPRQALAGRAQLFSDCERSYDF